MHFPFGGGLGGCQDLTWPPMLTSKNTTGLTGLEFATAMAPTRKQKSGVRGYGEPSPFSEGFVSGGGAGKADRSQAPPPEVLRLQRQTGRCVGGQRLLPYRPPGCQPAVSSPDSPWVLSRAEKLGIYCSRSTDILLTWLHKVQYKLFSLRLGGLD